MIVTENIDFSRGGSSLLAQIPYQGDFFVCVTSKTINCNDWLQSHQGNVFQVFLQIGKSTLNSVQFITFRLNLIEDQRKPVFEDPDRSGRELSLEIELSKIPTNEAWGFRDEYEFEEIAASGSRLRELI